MTRMVFHPLILSSGIQKFHTTALQKYNKFVNISVYENVVFVILDSISIKMSSNFFHKGLIHWAKFIHSSKLSLLLRWDVKNSKVLSMAYSVCVSSTAFHFRHQEHTPRIKHPYPFDPLWNVRTVQSSNIKHANTVKKFYPYLATSIPF